VVPGWHDADLAAPELPQQPLAEVDDSTAASRARARHVASLRHTGRYATALDAAAPPRVRAELSPGHASPLHDAAQHHSLDRRGVACGSTVAHAPLDTGVVPRRRRWQQPGPDDSVHFHRMDPGQSMVAHLFPTPQILAKGNIEAAKLDSLPRVPATKPVAGGGEDVTVHRLHRFPSASAGLPQQRPRRQGWSQNADTGLPFAWVNSGATGQVQGVSSDMQALGARHNTDSSAAGSRAEHSGLHVDLNDLVDAGH
jgi:hypothetical protein